MKKIEDDEVGQVVSWRTADSETGVFPAWDKEEGKQREMSQRDWGRG